MWGPLADLPDLVVSHPSFVHVAVMTPGPVVRPLTQFTMWSLVWCGVEVADMHGLAFQSPFLAALCGSGEFMGVFDSCHNGVCCCAVWTFFGHVPTRSG